MATTKSPATKAPRPSAESLVPWTLHHGRSSPLLTDRECMRAAEVLTHFLRDVFEALPRAVAGGARVTGAITTSQIRDEVAKLLGARAGRRLDHARLVPLVTVATDGEDVRWRELASAARKIAQNADTITASEAAVFTGLSPRSVRRLWGTKVRADVLSLYADRRGR